MKLTNITHRTILLAILPVLTVWLLMSFGFAQAGPTKESAVIECLDAPSNIGHTLYLPIISNDSSDLSNSPSSGRALVRSLAVSSEIVVGEVVSDEIDLADDCNSYRFSVTVGETIFFDAQVVSNSGIDWELTGSAGQSLFKTCLACSPVAETFGTSEFYTLTVGGSTGDYQFQLWSVPPPDMFEITDSDPQVGSIETPMAADIYTFTADAGSSAFFDMQMVTGTQAISWKLADPQGAILFNDCLSCGDRGPVELPSDGVYTLTVGGNLNSSIGSYQFVVTDAGAPNQFEIEIGDTVSPGQPRHGAGIIEYPGAFDIYTLDLLAGQIAFFDMEAYTGTASIAWTLTDPSGTLIFNECLACGDPGAIQFGQTGTYTITVGRKNDSDFGSYRFSVAETPPAETFQIQVGDVISDGNPAVGAGNIEQPGTFDIYTFETVSNTVIFADIQIVEPGLAVRWKLVDSDGTQLFRDCLACGDPGTTLLLKGGTYTVTVGTSQSTGTGTYQFQLWDIPPPERFEIVLGDVISPNVPAPGAGIIETPGFIDSYIFNAAAGETISFDLLDINGVSGVRWELRDPDDNEIFDQALFRGDIENVILPLNGGYTLIVGHTRLDQTGTYAFQILEVP